MTMICGFICGFNCNRGNYVDSIMRAAGIHFVDFETLTFVSYYVQYM